MTSRIMLNPRTTDGGDEMISLNWKEQGCDDVFGPHLLSDGTLRFIALCTLLMRPKEYGSEIIILDEPEIGLHPYAVHILAEIIKLVAGNVQIIVATQCARIFLNGLSR